MKCQSVKWFVAAALLLRTASIALASGETGGEGPFGLSLAFIDSLSIRRPIRLAVQMNGRYDSTTAGAARVALPAGLRLVEGDTLLRGHPAGSDNHWVLLVAIERAGRYEIQGDLTVSTDSGTDEGTVTLPFVVQADTAGVGWPRLVRSETVRNGQRYRYGGRFLVPISRSEKFTQTDLARLGVRAKAPRQIETTCADCDRSAPTIVRMVAFIGSDGKLIDSQVYSRGQNESAVTAARTALGRAQFTAAAINGSTVPDWVIVDVRVLGGE